MVEARVRAESRMAIAYAIFVILLGQLVIWSGTDVYSVVFYSVFTIALLVWIGMTWRRGELRLDEHGLMVRGWVRALRVPRSQLVGFDCRVVTRGMYRRHQVWVRLVDGPAIALDSIHGRPRSSKINDLVEQLNADLVATDPNRSTGRHIPPASGTTERSSESRSERSSDQD